MGSFIDPALPNTKTSEVRGWGEEEEEEEGNTVDGSPMEAAVITEIFFLSRLGRPGGRGQGGGGGAAFDERCPVEWGRAACGVRAGETRLEGESQARASCAGGVVLSFRGPVGGEAATCWVWTQPGLFLLTGFDRNSTGDGGSAAYRQIWDVWGEGKQRKKPQVWVVHWETFDFFFPFNAATWRGINSAPLPFPSVDSVTECSHNCYGNGECVAGSCHCFPGFIGPYCSRGNYPAPFVPPTAAFLAPSFFQTSDTSQHTVYWWGLSLLLLKTEMSSSYEMMKKSSSNVLELFPFFN